MKVTDFLNYKTEKKKISMVTSYDYWSARLISETNIDVILVGDSASMVMHGHPSTLQATPEMLATHVSSVAKGAPNKFLVADLPFPSFRMGIVETMRVVDLMMKAGANAVKLEGVRGHEEVVKHIVGSGVPVMGHVGLIPQSINKFGGFKVQGKDTHAAKEILEDAQALQDVGAFAVVLECVPSSVGRLITDTLKVPTIGIGAGLETDGQVLVLQDLLGLNADFQPRFVRKYLDGSTLIKEALNDFDQDIKTLDFPNLSEAYL